MKIRDMELLVRVAETGSMTLAAQQLSLTPAAVSATVQRVEAAVGIRIFARTTRTLHPTDEGQRLLEGCVEVVERWRRALDDARGHRAEPEGTVHLSAPADVTYRLLETIVGDVCHEHPKLRVVLDTSDHIKRLPGDAIDMAIRYGPLADSSLTVRKLVDGPAVLVAAPSYLEEAGRPETPAELTEHRCVTLLHDSAASWRVVGPDGEAEDVALRSPLCGDGYLNRRWAVAGLGIALKSLFDVIDELEDGTLERVLPAHTGGAVPIHLVFPSRRFLPVRVRVLDAALTAQFTARAARCRAWLEPAG